MNNELRDRIAEQLVAHPMGLRPADGEAKDWHTVMADAIIKAVGLRLEEVYLANGPVSGFVGGPYDGCKNGKHHRYVTAWTATGD